MMNLENDSWEEEDDEQSPAGDIHTSLGDSQILSK